jgi:3-methyladenine DNA glycosylase/8-oxoguanine DNA glycosylase
VPVILEQKVTGMEARRSWQALMRRHGEPAPGPAPRGMRVLPSPHVLRHLPSWEWHRMGVGPDRSRTIVRAAQVAGSLERLADRLPAEAMAGLQSVPGIGRWTAAEVVQRSHGDPDAVSIGDYNLPGVVAYALAGERTADDARMLELLEPYRGQRHRVCLLLTRAGPRAPRHGPRQPLRDYRAI